MRKLIVATAIVLAFAAPANAQYFWGSGPGGGMGGGWNNCANCGMRGYGPGGGYYSQWAAGTNGFGAGMRGWGGVPSNNNYGAGWAGPPMGAILGGIFGGGW